MRGVVRSAHRRVDRQHLYPDRQRSRFFVQYAGQHLQRGRADRAVSVARPGLLGAGAADQDIGAAGDRGQQRQQMARGGQMRQQVLVEPPTQEVGRRVEQSACRGGAADRCNHRTGSGAGQRGDAVRERGGVGIAGQRRGQRHHGRAVTLAQRGERGAVARHRDRSTSGGCSAGDQARADRPGRAKHQQRRHCPGHGILSPEKQASTEAGAS
ncbi:hypothetical protein BEN78_06675 [Xanthomonas citri pv. mangiferaeindicae]|nr:hypothetical protein BEN78_06675 [Xanthomonas citri pv. mangiferaeindicae]